MEARRGVWRVADAGGLARRTAQDRGGVRSRVARPGRRPAGRHTGRALRAVAGGGRSRRERGHHEPRACPAGIAAQKKTLIATERDEAARAQWRAELAAVDPVTVVFLDETSTQTVMTRARGRAPRGMRVVGAVPRNHGPNVSCLAARTPTGVCAPLVIEGAISGAVFVPWMRDWLLPRLAPGTSIGLDNLSVHRNAAVRAAVEAAGCHLRYLPAYSPDLNPIELAFAKLKTHLRGVAARSYAPLLDAIGEGLDRITSTDIAGFHRHCGYQLPPPATQPS
jgi:transposase